MRRKFATNLWCQDICRQAPAQPTCLRNPPGKREGVGTGFLRRRDFGGAVRPDLIALELPLALLDFDKSPSSASLDHGLCRA